MRFNPAYRSLPAPGHAEHELRKAGHSQIAYLGTQTTREGPVHVFETTWANRRGQIAVGRVYGDRLGFGSFRPYERARSAQQLDLFARKNPGKDDVYDPKMEQMRAITQGMYESAVRRATGEKEFRDARGMRADVKHSYFPDVGRMFAMRTGVGSRDKRMKVGTQAPTKKSVDESRLRYEGKNPRTGEFVGFEHLVQNRQDYEETLALGRKSAFYRVIPELARGGIKHCIWPMSPGNHLPMCYPGIADARDRAAELNRYYDPRKTGKWWTPSTRLVREQDLSYWLPPKSVFGRSAAGARKTAAAKVAVPPTKVVEPVAEPRASGYKIEVVMLGNIPVYKILTADGQNTGKWFYVKSKADRFVAGG